MYKERSELLQAGLQPGFFFVMPLHIATKKGTPDGIPFFMIFSLLLEEFVSLVFNLSTLCKDYRNNL